MSAKNSKFSGIFAQARQRETAHSGEEPAIIEAPIAAESVVEDTQNPPQNPSTAAETAGKSLPKAPIARRKTPIATPPKAEIMSSSRPQVADEATETTSATSPKGRPRGKRSDPNFTQITAYISKNTHQNVKLALLNEGQKREISELIEDQLAAWLAQITV